MIRKWKPLIVLISGLGVWGLSEVFQPWQYIEGNTSAIRSAGYHFYNSPPPIKSPAEMKRLFRWDRRDSFTSFPMAIRVRRDYLQSFAQRILLAWLTVDGLILSLNHGPRLLRILLWVFFCFGAAFSALL